MTISVLDSSSNPQTIKTIDDLVNYLVSTNTIGKVIPLGADGSTNAAAHPLYVDGSGATQAYDVSVTITRPANQTPYTANDVLGGALQFASMGPSGKTIMITSAELEVDISAIPSGMSTFRLYFYNVTPPSATGDNGAWDLPSGDRASFLGYVDLGAPVDLGSTCYCRIDGINPQFKLSGTDLFAYLVTVGGFTPAANSEVYKVTLHAQAV